MTEQVSMNEALRTQATNEVVNENPGIQNDPLRLIQEISKRFIEKQLDNFPVLCDVARVQNYIKWKELNETGKKGKYTGSAGWSEDGNFRFEYEIPNELYLFMVNLVYKDFWTNENSKIWRKFMKKVCDGEDAYSTLQWVKTIYGPNSQEGIVLN